MNDNDDDNDDGDYGHGRTMRNDDNDIKGVR